MRPRLEQEFTRETAELFEKSTPVSVRYMKLSRLIQLQEGCVRSYEDGSIVSPIDREDVADSKEYLERLKQLRFSLVS